MNREAISTVIAGAALACLGHLMRAVIPAVSRMVQLLQRSGSYTPSEFQLDLTLYFIIAYGLLAFGIYLLFFPRAVR